MSAHPQSWVRLDNLLIQQDHGDRIQARKVLCRAPGSLACTDASFFVRVAPRASEFGALAVPADTGLFPIGIFFFFAPLAATGVASNFCAFAKVPGEPVLALAVFPAEENVTLVGRWWSCRGWSGRGRSRFPRLIGAPLTAATCLAPALVIGAPGPHLFLATCVWRPTDECLRLNNLGAPLAGTAAFAA